MEDENLNNIEYSHKRHSTVGTDGQRVTMRQTGCGSRLESGAAKSSRATTSLENLNKLDIGPKCGGVRNSSISSTSSTPNPHHVDYMSNCIINFLVLFRRKKKHFNYININEGKAIGR